MIEAKSPSSKGLVAPCDIIINVTRQDESRNISKNSTWGIRRRFERGQYTISTKRFLGYDYDENGKLVVNKQQAWIVKRIYEECLSGKTAEYIARIFERERIKNWNGTTKWVPSSIDSMLRNEKYMGDTILQKSYTVDFLSKKRTVNDGRIQMFHIEEDHETIIAKQMWEAVQLEIKRRQAYCKEHQTNAYAQLIEKNPFSGKLICGSCYHTFSRFIERRGNTIKKRWRCGSSNMKNGRRVCPNRYTTEETMEKLFILGWNQLVNEHKSVLGSNKIEAKDDSLTDYKAGLIQNQIKQGAISAFDPDLMIAVMDQITIFEDGRLRIRFYHGVEYEFETE